MNKTYKLALFGDPVSHSLSPKIHKLFAKQCSIEIGYTLVQVGEKWFADQVGYFFENGGHGANITLPYKTSAVDITNNISEIAKTANAVNTLSRNEELELCGDNTDGIGFINDLKNRLRYYNKIERFFAQHLGGRCGIAINY